MLTYTVATSCNSVVGNVSPSVPATIATNLQAAGGGAVNITTNGSGFKLTGWNGTPANDPARYHAVPVVFIYANFGNSTPQLIVTAFDNVGTQLKTQTFSTNGAGLGYQWYTFRFPSQIASVSNANWTLQFSLTNYSNSIAIDQVYVRYISAGAYKDLDPVSINRPGWTRGGDGRDSRGFSGPGTSTRISYQYGGATLPSNAGLVGVTFLSDHVIDWGSWLSGAGVVQPAIVCQAWPLSNVSTSIDMNVFDNVGPTFGSPGTRTIARTEWGTLEFNWDSGTAGAGGYCVPTIAALNGGLVSCGHEFYCSKAPTGYGSATYSNGSEATGSPVTMRIYYDPPPFRNFSHFVEF